MKAIRCDVLVVGGGAAGIGAALAAAGRGARVLLLERDSFLGGLATAGMVGTICGLYLRGDEPRFICGGFVREWAERLGHDSGSRPVRHEHGLHVLPYDPWVFERLARDTIRRAASIRPVLEATLTGVRAEGGRLLEARARAHDREIAIHPSFVLDCTGVAAAVRLAGGSLLDDPADDSAALLFMMDGVIENALDPAGRLAALRAVARAVRDGRLPADCLPFSFVDTPPGSNRVLLKLALAAGQADWNSRTTLEFGARDAVDTLEHFLIAEVPAFARARRIRVAARVGVRSGRRVQGRALLTEGDVLACRKFTDGIARGAWPIETWGAGRRPRLIFFAENDYYEIPAGCLFARDLDNVLVAGRSLSATGQAMASTRVIATALATGWAAGALAAARADGIVDCAAIEKIRQDACL